MRCEWCKIWIPILIVVFIGFYIAYQFTPPPPPKDLRIATGREGGGYHGFALLYQKRLQEQGINVEIVPTAGSLAALEKLRQQEVDLAFVQGGVAEEVNTEGLQSIGSLFYEPLWVFYQHQLSLKYLFDLKGKKIAVGEIGSGTRPLALKLLSDNDISQDNTTFLNISSREAISKLRSGEVDAAFFVMSPKSKTISTLIDMPNIRLMNFNRYSAYNSHYPFSTHVKISEGMLNLGMNVPKTDTYLLSVTASLVTRSDIHPALIRLVLKEISPIHEKGGLLEKPETFPSRLYVELPIHPEAERYLKHGPSWLEHIFPFWVASMLERLKILLIPLLTLLIPLIKGAVPLYRWTIRFKIYRWYETLREVDKGVYSLELEVIEKEIQRLKDLQQELVEQVKVPLSYMSEFYTLRVHINLILTRLKEQQDYLERQKEK